MEHEIKWYEERDKWRQATKPYPSNSPDLYKPNELTMEVCDTINDIIVSTRGPYAPFHKKINLADLASIVEEIWDDQDDEWQASYILFSLKLSSSSIFPKIELTLK